MQLKRVRVTVLIAFGVITTACGQDSSVDSIDAADAVYLNGRLYTVSDDQPWAEALAIKDGRITYVGSGQEAQRHVGPSTKVVNLKGRMMLPGFQDAHVHPVSGGVEALSCDLNNLPDISAYRTTILKCANDNPELPWIIGGGWSMAHFGPGGAPNRNIIDELVPNRPVFLSSQDGHTGWANSAAMAIAGITLDTPDPADGRIDRDPETGEAIGSFQEGAQDLIYAHVPPTPPESYVAGLKYSVDLLNGYGITSVQAANVSAAYLRTYRSLEATGDLSLRVVTAMEWDSDRQLEQIPELVQRRKEYASRLINTSSVKIYQDGVMENYTAAVLEPYLIPGGSKGIPMIEPELLKDIVTALDANGFQVHFHAIGDAAVRQSLDAIEVARIANGDLDHRHTISHLQLIHPMDVPRFGELAVVANFQPLWALMDEYITELTLPFISAERAEWFYPIKSVQNAGGMIAFGSDWSVSTANPYHQIETAVLRKDSEDKDAEVLLPGERISLEAAIAAFTINAAFVNHQEDSTGSIEVGKFADLVVLDQDLFEIDPHDISETQTLLTLFEGQAVYGDPSAL